MIAIYIFEEWVNDEYIESDTLLIIRNGKAVYVDPVRVPLYSTILHSTSFTYLILFVIEKES